MAYQRPKVADTPMRSISTINHDPDADLISNLTNPGPRP